MDTYFENATPPGTGSGDRIRCQALARTSGLMSVPAPFDQGAIGTPQTRAPNTQFNPRREDPL
jgi:hypothetical protein